MDNFKFVFYANLLNEIFETTNILNLQLQSETMDVVTAFRLSEVTVAHLHKLSENDFESIFEASYEICEHEGFLINPAGSRRSGTVNSNDPNFKNQYKEQFQAVIGCFVNEIIERFNPKSYAALIEMYESFINVEYERELQVNKLDIYEKILDFDRYKLESKSFVCYKLEKTNINWANINILIAHFKEKNLKKFFPEVYKALKLYLSIPATSVTAERSFSCMKLIKTWLRSTMKNDRLSDLGIIKMNNHKNNGFLLNENDIIEDFINIPKSGRRLNLK